METRYYIVNIPGDRIQAAASMLTQAQVFFEPALNVLPKRSAHRRNPFFRGEQAHIVAEVANEMICNVFSQTEGAYGLEATAELLQMVWDNTHWLDDRYNVNYPPCREWDEMILECPNLAVELRQQGQDIPGPSRDPAPAADHDYLIECNGETLPATAAGFEELGIPFSQTHNVTTSSKYSGAQPFSGSDIPGMIQEINEYLTRRAETPLLSIPAGGIGPEAAWQLLVMANRELRWDEGDGVVSGDWTCSESSTSWSETLAAYPALAELTPEPACVTA